MLECNFRGQAGGLAYGPERANCFCERGPFYGPSRGAQGRSIAQALCVIALRAINLIELPVLALSILCLIKRLLV